MRILILQDDIPPESRGGAGIVAYDLAKTFITLGHQVFFVSATQDKKKQGESIQDGIKVYRIYSQYHRRWRAYVSLYNFQTIGKVRKIIGDIKPDIVHAHNIHFYLSYYCLKIAKLSGARVFLTAHDVMLINYGKIIIPPRANCDDFIKYCKVSAADQLKENKKRYNPLRNFIIRQYINKYVDRTIAVSDVLKKVLTMNGLRGVEVVHNGIDINFYDTEEESALSFKRSNGLENKKIVLFCGRIGEEKGVKQAVEALRRAMKEVPDLLFVVAGSESRDIVGTDIPIRFLGWLNHDDLKLAMAASDIVIYPSICFDTFGMILLEAMAAKKPVVSSCFGGMAEIVIDGETGYLLNPYNTETMAQKIAYLFKNPEKAAELGQKGYERVGSYFSLAKQAQDYTKLYVQ